VSAATDALVASTSARLNIAQDPVGRPRLHIPPLSRALLAAPAHRTLAVGILVLTAASIPAALSAVGDGGRSAPPRRSPPDVRYATQSGAQHSGRRAHVEQRTADLVDSAVETCGGVGLTQLAAKYQVPPEAGRVARRFASSFEPAYRSPVYRACLSGLEHGG
jgi:hypothetical protein